MPFVIRDPAPNFIPLIDDWNWDTNRNTNWSAATSNWDEAGGGGQNIPIVMTDVTRSTITMTTVPRS